MWMGVDARSITTEVMMLPTLVHWQRHVSSLLVSPVWWQWYKTLNEVTHCHHSGDTIRVWHRLPLVTTTLINYFRGLNKNVTFVDNIVLWTRLFLEWGIKELSTQHWSSHQDDMMQSRFLKILRYASWHWLAKVGYMWGKIELRYGSWNFSQHKW